MMQSMGLKRIGHDLVTEKQPASLKMRKPEEAWHLCSFLDDFTVDLQWVYSCTDVILCTYLWACFFGLPLWLSW